MASEVTAAAVAGQEQVPMPRQERGEEKDRPDEGEGGGGEERGGGGGEEKEEVTGMTPPEALEGEVMDMTLPEALDMWVAKHPDKVR